MDNMSGQKKMVVPIQIKESRKLPGYIFLNRFFFNVAGVELNKREVNMTIIICFICHLII